MSLLTVVIHPGLCFSDALILACVGSRLKVVETKKERVGKEGLRLPSLIHTCCVLPLLSCRFLTSRRSLASLSGTNYNPLDEPENQLHPKDYQGKRVNPWYRSYTQGNPS